MAIVIYVFEWRFDWKILQKIKCRIICVTVMFDCDTVKTVSVMCDRVTVSVTQSQSVSCLFSVKTQCVERQLFLL